MLRTQLLRNEEKLAAIKAIAESGEDPPVPMLNLNRYKAGTGFLGRVSMGTTSLDSNGFCPPSVGKSSGAFRCMGRQSATSQSTRFRRPDIRATKYP